MTTNISGFGLSARVTASNTYSSGFTVDEFSDDADPMDSPEVAIAETAFGLNGDMVTWSRAGGIEIVMGLIATSRSDDDTQVLLEANRVGKGKTSARDKVDIVFTYPNGDVVTCSNGVIVSGTLMPGVAANGRFKSRMYRYRFEKITKSKAAA